VVNALGFDKKGNFYYGVGDGDKFQEYFKVNTETLGPGASIGTTTEGNLFNEVGFGPIPGENSASPSLQAWARTSTEAMPAAIEIRTWTARLTLTGRPIFSLPTAGF
jgi:hypothetical protein